MNKEIIEELCRDSFFGIVEPPVSHHPKCENSVVQNMKKVKKNTEAKQQ